MPRVALSDRCGWSCRRVTRSSRPASAAGALCNAHRRTTFTRYVSDAFDVPPAFHRFRAVLRQGDRFAVVCLQQPSLAGEPLPSLRPLLPLPSCRRWRPRARRCCARARHRAERCQDGVRRNRFRGGSLDRTAPLMADVVGAHRVERALRVRRPCVDVRDRRSIQRRLAPEQSWADAGHGRAGVLSRVGGACCLGRSCWRARCRGHGRDCRCDRILRTRALERTSGLTRPPATDEARPRRRPNWGYSRS